MVPFDHSKAINNRESSFALSCQGSASIWLEVDSTQKNLTFSFTPSTVAQFYSLNWSSTKNEVVRDTLQYSKKIVDIFFGGMGQSSKGDTVFILFEDGTVEYIPIVHMFNEVQGKVASYGTIPGVSGVTKFALASTTGAVTTLGIKNDGSFYDLGYALKDSGNY